MELALCLGENTNKFSFLEKPSKINNNPSASSTSTFAKGLIGFGLDALGFGGHRSLSSSSSPSVEDEKTKNNKRKLAPPRANDSDGFRVSSSVDPSLQLQLHFPWLPENSRQRGRMLSGAATVAEEEEDAAPSMSVSPPNSVTSSFRLDFGIKSYGYERRSNKRDIDDEVERSTSRASNEDNDDENGAIRKKLRLSKDQSAFLEDSFKEHSTLNPKQKIALAKQLNLRPRQIEVWFQNRRARTKLKQTEVDCEYLKRCCESLTEENRRLQKEVKELRALKTSSPFYMQLPATTLTMCPSCERVATSASQPSTSSAHNIFLSKKSPSNRDPLLPVKPGPANQVS